MCTVTILPIRNPHSGPGLRVVCNRDESRTREAAHEPRIELAQSCATLMPTDPAGGGTWIAANDFGLGFVLLNVNLNGDTQQHVTKKNTVAAAVSRGLIIPSLVKCASFSEAISRVRQLPAVDFQPFRLLMMNDHDCVEVFWDGHGDEQQKMCINSHGTVARPMLFCSSGLGDELVTQPRRDLLRSWLDRGFFDAAAQDLFHQHRWPDHPELSVCMERSDALTVSRTVMQIDSQMITMQYQSLWPQPAGPILSWNLTMKSAPTH